MLTLPRNPGLLPLDGLQAELYSEGATGAMEILFMYQNQSDTIQRELVGGCCTSATFLSELHRATFCRLCIRHFQECKSVR
jgi:hypothetical protein